MNLPMYKGVMLAKNSEAYKLHKEGETEALAALFVQMAINERNLLARATQVEEQERTRRSQSNG